MRLLLVCPSPVVILPSPDPPLDQPLGSRPSEYGIRRVRVPSLAEFTFQGTETSSTVTHLETPIASTSTNHLTPIHKVPSDVYIEPSDKSECSPSPVSVVIPSLEHSRFLDPCPRPTVLSNAKRTSPTPSTSGTSQDEGKEGNGMHITSLSQKSASSSATPPISRVSRRNGKTKRASPGSQRTVHSKTGQHCDWDAELGLPDEAAHFLGASSQRTPTSASSISGMITRISESQSSAVAQLSKHSVILENLASLLKRSCVNIEELRGEVRVLSQIVTKLGVSTKSPVSP